MTPEELIKPCDAAAKDGRSCGHRFFEHECVPCGRRRLIHQAERELEDFGFSSPARARSYAALWAALDWAGTALEESRDPDDEAQVCYKDTCTPENCVHLAIKDALATEEKES